MARFNTSVVRIPLIPIIDENMLVKLSLMPLCGFISYECIRGTNTNEITSVQPPLKQQQKINKINKINKMMIKNYC